MARDGRERGENLGQHLFLKAGQGWVNQVDQIYKNIVGLMCSHYSEMGYLKQRCYEIIGYLDWWDFTKKPRKNI